MQFWLEWHASLVDEMKGEVIMMPTLQLMGLPQSGIHIPHVHTASMTLELCSTLTIMETFLDGSILIWSPLITIAIKMLCTPSSFGPWEGRQRATNQRANRWNRWTGRIEREEIVDESETRAIQWERMQHPWVGNRAQHYLTSRCCMHIKAKRWCISGWCGEQVNSTSHHATGVL